MEQSKQQRIRELTDRLNRCRYEYYNLNAPSLTDAEYDALFDELSVLEKETGFNLTNSPTQTVGCYPAVSTLEKTTHKIPLLSLDKTKSSTELLRFAGEQMVMLMIDRCECVLFLNTNQSILPYEKTLRDATDSPWIYSEIVCTQLIRHKELKEYRKEIFHEDQRMLFEVSEGFHPAYSVSLDHLMPLDIGNLMKWEQSYRKATSKKHYPLDYLYQQFPVRD